MNTIDLHIHSYFSDDGQFNEIELVDKAIDLGVMIMSIADHNSVKANELASDYAASQGIKYINNIEIDCSYNSLNLHVLGMGIDYHDEIFQIIEYEIYQQELQASQKRVELTNKLGFDLNVEELEILSTNGVYTGEMFGEVILNDSRFANSEILKPYRKNGSKSDNPFVNFYWDYYAPGKPCYSFVKYRSLKEIIDIIHKSGGYAVIAHPGKNLEGKFEIIDELIELGLDGIEAFSTYHNNETCNYFKQKAIENSLLYTIGSDFHGKTKPSISIGLISDEVDENEIFKMLKERKLI